MPENTAPIFVQDLTPLVTATAGENEFTFDVTIPNTFDAEGDNVEIFFDFSSLTTFLKYDESLRKIVPNRAPGINFDFVPPGEAIISIEL